MYSIFYFPELGEGWDLAFIDTEGELNFIREGNRGLTDIRSYWIGGYSDFDSGSIIGYSNYYTSDSGNDTRHNRNEKLAVLRYNNNNLSLTFTIVMIMLILA